MNFDPRWLAGLFDGEGHVSLAYTTNGSKGGQRSFRLQIGIAQKNVPFLRALKRVYGGCIGHEMQLCLQNRQAEAFLRIIEPYVVLKKKVVKLALQYRALVKDDYGHRGGYYGNPMPKRVFNQKMAIRNKIMQLNRAN